MHLSVRTRFEVFKRDRFTCAYCGRTPPEVLLEVDHVVPRAAGGGDEMPNLVTACQTCNRGKAAKLLDEGAAPVVGRATVEELQERLEQAKAYVEAMNGLKAVINDQVAMVIDGWAEAFGATIEERETGTVYILDGYKPWIEDRSIRYFLRHLTLDEVLEAIDITAGRIHYSGQDACRFFYGVCHRMIGDKRG